MSVIICPSCSAELFAAAHQYTCSGGHCFDRAKQGYVNLLMSQKSSDKRHGDDTVMVNARADFLSAGFYQPLLEALCRTAAAHIQNGGCLLDAGCGEGYYTAGVWESLLTSGVCCEAVGTDISKNALKAACRRSHEITWITSSVSSLPVKSSSVDIILNVFAPHSDMEFYRILKKDGVLIRVIPLERHLYSLKSAVYEQPYENIPELPRLFGFEQCERTDIKYSFTVTDRQISNLFKMTPYYYKTSAEDFQKLCQLTTLTTEAEFAVLTYRKA